MRGVEGIEQLEQSDSCAKHHLLDVAWNIQEHFSRLVEHDLKQRGGGDVKVA